MLSEAKHLVANGDRPNLVMLSEAKHLVANRDGPFAEFTLSETNVLRVTLRDCSNCQELLFTIEPCLKVIIGGNSHQPKVSHSVTLSRSEGSRHHRPWS